MVEIDSLVVGCARAFFAALIVSYSFLAPLKVDAQSAGAVMMACTNQYPGQRNLSIELATKRVVVQIIDAAGGTSRSVHKLTQITKQQIVWIEERKDNGHRYGHIYNMNRCTGVLTLVPLGSVDGVTPWGNSNGI
jgi:hypothetical protein